MGFPSSEEHNVSICTDVSCLGDPLFCLRRAVAEGAGRVNVLPARPLIEHRGSVRFLNFDFLLKNNGTAELHLNRMQVSVYD